MTQEEINYKIYHFTDIMIGNQFEFNGENVILNIIPFIDASYYLYVDFSNVGDFTMDLLKPIIECVERMAYFDNAVARLVFGDINMMCFQFKRKV
jgi:hypothetical protein